jgi:hypothetical protein
MRMLRAALLFGASILAFVAVTVWSLYWPAGQDGEWSRAQEFAVLILLFGVFASTVNFFVAAAKLFWFYRCPSCGKRLTRPNKEIGPIVYPCDSCGVLWHTGWEADLPD